MPPSSGGKVHHHPTAPQPAQRPRPHHSDNTVSVEEDREGEVVMYFTFTLIAHTDLELNAQKQTQYLKDDCLHFRITKIEAQK